MAQLTCVYCFEKFQPQEIQFRCLNPNPVACSYEQDEPLERYVGKSLIPQPRVFPAASNSGIPTRATCTCGLSSNKAVCPRCHNELPNQFGQTDEIIVALIGAKSVGKSHYITVLIHELKNRIGAWFNASLTASSEETIRRYNEDFSRFIYQRAEIIPGTFSARAQIKVRYPLVFRLDMDKKTFFGTQRKIIHLVFFDTAGEDLASLDLMSTETRYIANADGLIFLLDPLQIPAVRQQVPAGVNLPPEGYDQSQIIERASVLIQQMNALKPNQKIDIPVAVAFSKIDALRSVVDASLLQASRHHGFLDLSDVEMANGWFKGYVGEWMGMNMVNILNNLYREFSFFGLSALGDSPDHAGRLRQGVNPFRIEDPLLWILYKKGLISARKTRKNSL
ncbi:MAG: hypothetical protein C4524_11710 [Candidatus Zixiibacteriota bacterium]|nr:MAG: hypothetical protein C4524_11710 [candidate division Zixibacteria bacterium]